MAENAELDFLCAVAAGDPLAVAAALASGNLAFDARDALGNTAMHYAAMVCRRDSAPLDAGLLPPCWPAADAYAGRPKPGRSKKETEAARVSVLAQLLRDARVRCLSANAQKVWAHDLVPKTKRFLSLRRELFSKWLLEHATEELRLEQPLLFSGDWEPAVAAVCMRAWDSRHITPEYMDGEYIECLVRCLASRTQG